MEYQDNANEKNIQCTDKTRVERRVNQHNTDNPQTEHRNNVDRLQIKHRQNIH